MSSRLTSIIIRLRDYRAYRDRVEGPLLACLAIGALELIARTPLRVASPLAPLMIVTVYSTFRGGLWPGLVSALASCVYFGISLFHRDGAPVETALAWGRIISWAWASPAMVLIVASLKRQSLQQHAEEGGRRRERFVTELADSMPQIAWTAGSDGEFNHFNGHWFEYTGASLEQSRGAGWTAFLHPEDVAGALGLWESALRSGSPCAIRFRIRRGADASYRWHIGRALPVRAHDQSISKWIGLCLDVHDQKEALSELSETQVRLSTVLSRAPVILWSADLDGRITYCEGNGMASIGLAPGQLLASSIFELYRGQPELLAKLGRVYAGESFSAETARRGAWFETHYFPFFGPDGEVTGIGGVSTEITARKLVDQERLRLEVSEKANSQLEARVQERTRELEATARRFRRLASSNMIGIMFWNNEGRITEANDAFLGMTGYTREDVASGALKWKGLTPQKFVTQDAEARAELNATGVCRPFEKEFLHKDGHSVPILIGAATFEEDAENGVCFVLDRTETKQVEAERNRLHLSEQAALEASRMKSTFLANMSHEIRTPINGVMGMASLLLDTVLTPEQRSYGETIRGSADSLLTLVNDILDLSKAEAGKIDLEVINFDLNQVIVDIERTLAFNARKKGLKLLKSVSTDLPSYLKGDPTRIGQVLLNLVNNAIKFTPSGQVTIEVGPETRPGQPALLRIEITDTGIGIPEESMERMFRSFSQADSSTTRRFGGTGLGLSICKHLVTLMGGQIGVRSQQGAGSTFWFTLPPQAGSHLLGELPRDQAPLAEAPHRRLRILVAEDNSVNQLIVLKMLERLGHAAVAVANGFEAIDALRDAHYDLVFMDCQMPELDGYEATRRIRASASLAPEIRALPIVAMTANAMAGDREKCLEAGMTDYVSKPMKPRDLQAAIERTLARQSDPGRQSA